MGSRDNKQTVTQSRQPLEGTQTALNSILQQAETLPGTTIARDPSTTAGLEGLQGVAGQPGIAGGASFLNQFLGPQGGLGTAIDTLQGTAQGDLVTSNPALLEALAAQREPVTSNILGRFAAAGRSGLNPAVAREGTEAQTRTELPLIAQDIATQQARQQEAARFLPGLFGTLGQAATFAPGLQLQAGQAQEQFDRSNVQAEQEQQRLRALLFGQAAQLGTPFATTTQETVKPGPSPLQTALGIGTTLAGAALGGPAGASIGSSIGGSLFGGSNPANQVQNFVPGQSFL